MSEQHPDPQLLAEAERAWEILKAADTENPDPAQVATLRKALADVPALASIYGNLQLEAKAGIVQRLTGRVVRRESINQHCDQMRVEMGYERGTPLERMLIEHIELCWLRLHEVEIRHTEAHLNNAGMMESEYWEKRLSSTHRRYLRAIEALVRVRRLLREPPAPTSPAFNLLLRQQLNIGA